MKIERLLTNICSNDLEQSKLFYTSLLSFEVNYDSDWFIHLVSKGNGLELGLIIPDHEVVPELSKGSISGAYLTFVVEDVDSIYNKIKASSVNVLEAPKLTSYGQKRMLVRAPEGTVCDISSPTKA